MAGIIVNQDCPLCNADGYMIVSVTEWKNFAAWHEDPREDKMSSPDAFPVFMKNLHNFMGGPVGIDKYWVMCPNCNGNKTVQKEISFDELKELLK